MLTQFILRSYGANWVNRRSGSINISPLAGLEPEALTQMISGIAE